MPQASLARMSNDALLKLRADVDKTLNRRADELRGQLFRVDGSGSGTRRVGASSLQGRKVPVKFRDRSGNTWAGRGAMPVWLRDKIKAGAKLEDFAVDRTRAKGRKKRRKTKR